MADEADTANDYAEQARAMAIRNISDHMRRTSEALENCAECGEPIPQARREAMPGCEHCIKCQSWLDKGNKFYP